MSFGDALVFVIGILFICLIWCMFGGLCKKGAKKKLEELEEEFNDLPKNTFSYDVANLNIALLKLFICLLGG